jgi:hypothetical protein
MSEATIDDKVSEHDIPSISVSWDMILSYYITDSVPVYDIRLSCCSKVLIIYPICLALHGQLPMTRSTFTNNLAVYYIELPCHSKLFFDWRIHHCWLQVKVWYCTIKVQQSAPCQQNISTVTRAACDWEKDHCWMQVKVWHYIIRTQQGDLYPQRISTVIRAVSYPIHSCFSSEVPDVRSDQIRSTDPYWIHHDKLLYSYPVHITSNTAYFLHLVYPPFWYIGYAYLWLCFTDPFTCD